MTEKTAEEKLRQALEGSITESIGQDNSPESRKPRPRKRTKSQSRNEKPENLGQRLDSFMDDFERRIEQSLNAIKSPSEPHEKPRHVSRPLPRRSAKHETPDKPDIMPETAPVETVNDSQEVPETSQPETTTVETVNDSQEVPEIVQPESAPVETVNDSQEVPEIVQPETATVETVDDTQELPAIPVIEADFYQPENADDTQELDGGLPDIPVITPDDDEDDDDFTENFIDETVAEDEPTQESTSDDDTEQDTQVGFQEAELLEAPQNDDDFADIDDFSDEPIDEAPADDTQPNDSDNDEAGLLADDDSRDEFSPAADLVVNVDDELPQITAQNEPENDPEAEPVPVTVTMPETTKTAEDKLMADIAEAMTGSPLNLGAQEQPGLYPLPEDFLNDANQGDSQQSAEDKLKANIAQALSESPIEAAQNNASQNLEEDINPFDDMQIPDPPYQPNDDTETEQSQEDDMPSETLIDEPDEQTVDVADDEAVPENDTEQEAAPENDYDAPNDPFTIPDFGDDEPEQSQNFDTSNEPETVPETILDTEPELDPEAEAFQEPEISADDMPFPADDELAQEETLIPQDEPLTEQARLEQEIAAITQEFEPEDTITDTEPSFDTDNIQKEAEPENNMPEQSLLNDTEPETTVDDDWDISSLGELAPAATIPGDDPDDFHADPETVTEMITQPENISPAAGIANNPENDHKEKTMNIREKLAERKKGHSDTSSSSGKSKGGIILPLLLGAIAVIGGLILWQIMTLSDKVTSLAMNSPAYESSARIESNPSYDYVIDFILDPNLTDRMSQRGREGWQVVGSRRTQDSTTGQYGYEFIFMRRTPGR